MLQITISKRAAFIALVAVLLVIPVAAFAGSVFDDVDDGSTHIDGITYLKDSGVSVGCDANNNFCPDDNVTRAQMGTFMYRLSGNDPATAPSVNADKVDGLHAGDIVRVYGAASDVAIGNFTASEFTDVISDMVVAPVDGLLHITGSISAEAEVANGSVGHLFLMIALDGTALWSQPRGWQMATDITDGADSTSFTIVVPVTAGSYTVSLQAIENANGSFILGRSISTIFVASGEGVAFPFGASTPSSQNR